MKLLLLTLVINVALVVYAASPSFNLYSRADAFYNDGNVNRVAFSRTSDLVQGYWDVEESFNGYTTGESFHFEVKLASDPLESSYNTLNNVNVPVGSDSSTTLVRPTDNSCYTTHGTFKLFAIGESNQ